MQWILSTDSEIDADAKFFYSLYFVQFRIFE